MKTYTNFLKSVRTKRKNVLHQLYKYNSELNSFLLLLVVTRVLTSNQFLIRNFKFQTYRKVACDQVMGKPLCICPKYLTLVAGLILASVSGCASFSSASDQTLRYTLHVQSVWTVSEREDELYPSPIGSCGYIW